VIAELIMGPAPGDKDPGKGPAKDGKGWSVDGWVRWLEGLRGNYERRMNTMSTILDNGRELVKSGRRGSLVDALAETSLYADDDDEWAVVEKTTIYSFDWPVGGMFLWIKFNFETHPLASKVDHAKLSRALWIYWTSEPYRVLVSPGSIFSPTEAIAKKDGYKFFRLCFAACDENEIKPISERFVDGTNSIWKIKSVSKIQELLSEDEEALEMRAGDLDLARLCSLSGPC
jgi:hypothetical protein